MTDSVAFSLAAKKIEVCYAKYLHIEQVAFFVKQDLIVRQFNK